MISDKIYVFSFYLNNEIGVKIVLTRRYSYTIIYVKTFFFYFLLCVFSGSLVIRPENHKIRIKRKDGI